MPTVTVIFVASAIAFFTCSMFQRKMEQLNAAPFGISILGYQTIDIEPCFFSIRKPPDTVQGYRR
jgi:hypothetical protein